MKGGTWNALNGDPAQLKPPIATLNTLQGGFGKNTLVGGDLSGQGYDAEKMAQWNVLIANPGEILGSGQDAGGNDVLEAGTAGATMKGGALGGDTFHGSSDPLAEYDPNSVDPIPALPVRDDRREGREGARPDTMEGGYGQYGFPVAGGGRAAHCLR